jgi:uncharacterized protein YhhL (DUF1145 family)
MPILTLIAYLVAIGIVMYFVNIYAPMAEPYKKILNIVVVIIVIIWLLDVFGLFTSATVPRLH